MLWISLGVSAILHLAFLALYPRLMRREVAHPVPFLLPVDATRPEGMQVIEVIEVADAAEPETPPAPAELRPARAPATPPERPVVEDELGRGEIVAPGPTAAERLRPALRDRRLWAPVAPEDLALTREQILELDLRAAIREFGDSAAAAEALARRATDWTYTDGEGRKWGVSEGKLHLGDITLPLPFSFGVTPDRRDEVARRAWEWEELRRGAVTGEIRDSWKDRARAIRERRDRERRQARPDTTGRR